MTSKELFAELELEAQLDREENPEAAADDTEQKYPEDLETNGD